MLGSVRNEEELGINFGATLTQKEVEWLFKEEFATSAEDILWRRSKLGRTPFGERSRTRRRKTIQGSYRICYSSEEY